MPELYPHIPPFHISWFDSKDVTILHACSSMEQDFGLILLYVATWGTSVLIPLQNSTKQAAENAWLGSASEILRYK